MVGGAVILMFLILGCICWRWKSGGPPAEEKVPVPTDGEDVIDAGMEEGREVCVFRKLNN